MARLKMFFAVVLCLTLAKFSSAADLPLVAVSGAVFKANANMLIIQPRTPTGQFGAKLVLKVRGTSKVWALSSQKRDGNLVVVQREEDVKDLQPKQSIAVIYTTSKEDNVLLTAVVQPGEGK